MVLRMPRGAQNNANKKMPRNYNFLFALFSFKFALLAITL